MTSALRIGRRRKSANRRTSWSSTECGNQKSATAVASVINVPSRLPSSIFDFGLSTSPSWSSNPDVSRGRTPYSGQRPTGDTLAPPPHLKTLSQSVSTGNSTCVTDLISRALRKAALQPGHSGKRARVTDATDATDVTGVTGVTDVTDVTGVLLALCVPGMPAFAPHTARPLQWDPRSAGFPPPHRPAIQ